MTREPTFDERTTVDFLRQQMEWIAGHYGAIFAPLPLPYASAVQIEPHAYVHVKDHSWPRPGSNDPPYLLRRAAK